MSPFVGLFAAVLFMSRVGKLISFCRHPRGNLFSLGQINADSGLGYFLRHENSLIALPPVVGERLRCKL